MEAACERASAMQCRKARGLRGCVGRGGACGATGAVGGTHVARGGTLVGFSRGRGVVLERRIWRNWVGSRRARRSAGAEKEGVEGREGASERKGDERGRDSFCGRAAAGMSRRATRLTRLSIECQAHGTNLV